LDPSFLEHCSFRFHNFGQSFDRLVELEHMYLVGLSCKYQADLGHKFLVDLKHLLQVDLNELLASLGHKHLAELIDHS